MYICCSRYVCDATHAHVQYCYCFQCTNSLCSNIICINVIVFNVRQDFGKRMYYLKVQAYKVA